MSALDLWRRELRLIIPRVFLRRDQGDGLFVSDYPRQGESAAVSARLREMGFSVTVRGTTAYLDASADRYQALLNALPQTEPEPAEDALPLYALAQRLLRGGAPFTPEAVSAVRLSLKMLDAGDFSGLYRALSPLSAEAQRKRQPLPAALGRLILFSLYQ